MSHAADTALQGSARLLVDVLGVLERATVRYCILHGYEGYPHQITSDVDCVVSDAFPRKRLVSLFCNRDRPGLDLALVAVRGESFVFARKEPGRPACFLTLDMSVDCAFGGLRFYAGSELLQDRRQHNGFWVPAISKEFGATLLRRVAKLQLDDRRAARLSNLYVQDPVRCRNQIARFWKHDSAALIITAAESGDWRPVRRSLPTLRSELRGKLVRRHPGYLAKRGSLELLHRLRSVCAADVGLIVAFLGPDGAGKSSVIRALPTRLDGVFSRTKTHGFAPGILSWLRPPQGANSRPHAVPPRSYAASVSRAALYWLLYYQLCYRPAMRFALARSTLVIHDRHLIDALVDPRRYRYAGPSWLIKLIWMSIRQPDVIVILDAPAKRLQERKQEVTFAESARQRRAYKDLRGIVADAEIIDASQPLEMVIEAVEISILQRLAARVALADHAGTDDRLRRPVDDNRPALHVHDGACSK